MKCIIIFSANTLGTFTKIRYETNYIRLCVYTQGNYKSEIVCVQLKRKLHETRLNSKYEYDGGVVPCIFQVLMC